MAKKSETDIERSYRILFGEGWGIEPLFCYTNITKNKIFVLCYTNITLFPNQLFSCFNIKSF